MNSIYYCLSICFFICGRSFANDCRDLYDTNRCQAYAGLGLCDIVVGSCNVTCGQCPLNDYQYPVWSSWTDYGLCSVTCGGGTQSRTRECIRNSWQNQCFGSSSESRECSTNRCPEVCQDLNPLFCTWIQDNNKCFHVPYFTWVNTYCKKTCGLCSPNGFDLRQLITATPYVTTTPAPQWNVYSECSRSCGTGTRYKIPRCASNNINTCPKVYEKCNTTPCLRVQCSRPEIHRYNDISSCCKIPSSDICGVQPFTYSRIYGGQSTSVREWPWMVRIETQTTTRTGTYGLCGGTLIDNKWIATAAHCVSGYPVSHVSAYTSYGLSNQVKLKIASIRLNISSYYFTRSLANDIALLELETKVVYDNTVRPLCLPRGEVSPDDTKCYALGWGVTESGQQSGYLQQVELRKLPIGICKEAYRGGKAESVVNDKIICAGHLSGGKDTCLGDSGGPLMCQRCSSCQWFLAGITSFGSDECGQRGRPGVYVNVVHYENWIRLFTTATQTTRFSCLGQ